MHSLKKDYTIIIVTHNMQQAARVSEYTGFMLIQETGEPGRLVEYGLTSKIFTMPDRKETEKLHHGKVRVAMTRQSFHEGLRSTLNEEILRMGSLVVEAVDLSTQSLFKGDRSLANAVIAATDDINELNLADRGQVPVTAGTAATGSPGLAPAPHLPAGQPAPGAHRRPGSQHCQDSQAAGADRMPIPTWSCCARCRRRLSK